MFDIETQKLTQEVGGWDHVDKLGVSVACAYDSKTGEYLTFLEKDLPKLFDLMQDRLVIGYNIRGFDLKVLQPYGLAIQHLDVFDILYDIANVTRQKFIKLEAVAMGTLGYGKSAEGTQAVEWWKSGEVDKIIEYCLQDVKVTQEVFQHGREKGYVKIQLSETNTKEVKVNWN